MICFFDGYQCVPEGCSLYEFHCKEEFELDNDDDLEDYYDWDYDSDFED